MDFFRFSELAAIVAGKVTAPAVLIKTEDEESCVQSESISTASQQDSLVPPFNDSEKSEPSTIQLSQHALQPTRTGMDILGEQPLRSFQDSTVPNPPTPGIVTTVPGAAFAKVVSGRPMAYQTVIQSIDSESALDNLSPPSLRASSMSPISDFPQSQTRPSQSTDDGGKSRHRVMGTITPLSQQSTANSKSPLEEVQVPLLQDKVEQAAADEQALHKKVENIWRQKQNYDVKAADLDRVLEATRTDIKGLHAERRKIEAAVKQKKARLNEITHDKQRLEVKAKVKWEEGKSVKRDVDEAARSRRALEKQLKEAKFQEELVRLYPDAGLRKFAEKASTTKKHSELLNVFAQGQARDDDFDVIENLLEEAEDGTKNDIKVELQPMRSERNGIDRAELLDRAESLVKTEFVKIKAENASTPHPTLHGGDSSSPTAQSLLEAVRQMKASRKNLYTQLHKIKSLKRKHQQDDDDSDASPARTRRVKTHVPYQPDTNTDSDSGDDEEQSVDPDKTDDEE